MAVALALRSNGGSGITISLAPALGGGTDGFVDRWDGAAFVCKPVKRWDGSSLVQKALKFWDGAAWVLGCSAGGGGSPVTIGETGLGGVGNWPTSGDRALMTKAVVASTTALTQFNLRTTSANAAGEQYKGLMYAADGTGGNPGTLLAYTVASSVVGAGVQLVTMAVVGSPSLTPQNVWIGYVAAGTAGGSGGETDSGAAGASGDSIMLNGGETSYASPSNPAGNWPGSPGPYSNKGAFWWDGTA